MISARELFIRHNLRCTRQRLALYEALRMCKSHPTAEELFQLAMPSLGSSPKGGMSRATVYNTLEALVGAGLTRRMPAANGCCRYDADTSEHLHVRLRNTGEICDVPHELGERLIDTLPRALLSEIERQMNIRIDGVSIQFTATSRA